MNIAMNAVNKRKRIVLDIEQKIEIIERLETGDSVNFLALIYDVGKSTISDIRKNKDSLIQFALSSKNSPRKRKAMKLANNVALEESVYAWYLEKLSKGENVPGPLLCEKALEVNKEMRGPTDFKASTGWLKHFKLRHGIGELNVEGETLPEEHPSDSFKNRLLKIAERSQNKCHIQRCTEADENITSSPDIDYFDIDNNYDNMKIINKNFTKYTKGTMDYKKHKAKCKSNVGLYEQNYNKLDKTSLSELLGYVSSFNFIKENYCANIKKQMLNISTLEEIKSAKSTIHSYPDVTLYCNKEKLIQSLNHHEQRIKEHLESANPTDNEARLAFETIFKWLKNNNKASESDVLLLQKISNLTKGSSGEHVSCIKTV